MNDLFETTIICKNCKKPAHQNKINKEGFIIRSWHCLECNKIWHHPADLAHFKEYQALKDKDFKVKIRSVGNSWVISIPKEITRFKDIHETKTVKLHLDDPDKLTITFTHLRKLY